MASNGAGAQASSKVTCFEVERLKGVTEWFLRWTSKDASLVPDPILLIPVSVLFRIPTMSDPNKDLQVPQRTMLTTQETSRIRGCCNIRCT